MKDFKNFSGDERIDRAARSAARECEGKSEKDIFAAIRAQAEQGKRNGTLTNDDIDRFYAAVSPSLSSSQRKKLKKVVEELKKI